MAKEKTAEMFVAVCQKCQKQWDAAILAEWGTEAFPETHCCGPKPMCVAIVPNYRGTAGEVCGGDLRLEARR